jgi:hypothetical protein
MPQRRVPLLVLLGVFLIAGATLGVEILLTRVLALMMWHHLTYVVIGVALVGFGAAGSAATLLASTRRTGQPLEQRLARYAFWTTVFIPFGYAAATTVRLDANALVAEPINLVALALLYVLIVTPFFFGGLAICEALAGYRGQVGRVYFADLIGAGLGGAAALFAIEPLTAPGAIVGGALLTGLAALCFELAAPGGLAGKLRRLASSAALLAFLGLVVLPAARAGRIDPPLAPDKELAVGIAQNTAKVDERRWNPLARIDVSAPLEVALRSMGGAFPPGFPPVSARFLFQDGTAPSVYIGWDGDPAKLKILEGSSAGVGYAALRTRGLTNPEALAIGIGGGPDLLIGLANQVKRITGAEINRSTVDLLRDTFREFTGNLVDGERVRLVNAEGRHYVRSGDQRYDLIQLSGVDTYTALANGAYTLSESYLYTKEAIAEFLDGLTPDGILSYCRIVFPDKPRESLRLAMTALEVLEERGFERPREHLFILHGGGWASILISLRAFSEAELVPLREFVTRYEYLPLFDPGMAHPGAFQTGLDTTADNRQAFYRDYPYQVRPATDDRPFFFNYFKWRSLLQWKGTDVHTYFIDYPMGHAALLASLTQAIILGALFILWPLTGRRRLAPEVAPSEALPALRKPRWGEALAALLFFFALGLGFIAIEVTLMQHLVLFLGHPTLSLATVLPALLIGAGLGSLSVGPASSPRRRLLLLLLLAPAVALGSAWVTPALDGLLGAPLWQRVGAAAGLLLPIGFVLGQAFPAGVRLVEARSPEFIPWCWAINAFSTVVGSTGTVLVAMELGFTATLYGVAPLYALGILAMLLAFRGNAAQVQETARDSGAGLQAASAS